MLSDSIDEKIESLKRDYETSPEDVIKREALEAAYIRGGRGREAMVLLHPEVYQIIREGYPEALRMMEHYEYHRPGFDANIPNLDSCMSALYIHLRNHPNLAEEIKQMHKPVLQLVPIFEEGQEGIGFSRLIQALNRKKQHEQSDTYISPSLTRWNYKTQVSEEQGKIVGWKVAIVEGTEFIRLINKFYRGESLEEQLHETLDDYNERKLQMIDKVKWTLLLMNTLITKVFRRGIDASRGIDDVQQIALYEPSREDGDMVARVGYDGIRAVFFEEPPDSQNGKIKFRYSVIAETIL